MRRLAQTTWLTLWVALVVGGTCVLGRAADASLEYRVKAAFLYNFAKFVTWPPQVLPAANDPLVFCVVGTDFFQDMLDSTLDDRRVEGRAIVVRRLRSDTQLAGCHLVFASESEGERAVRVLQEAVGSRVLTVGEADDFLARGGMIRLLVDEGKVRFDISVRAAESAGLKFSSQLLKLARQVER
jgi:hypothetical protein